MDSILFKRIRCMDYPRFAYYDKESKVTTFIDTDLDGAKTPFHISWKPRGTVKGDLLPQVDVKDMTFDEAAEFGVKAARDGSYKEYELQAYDSAVAIIMGMGA